VYRIKHAARIEAKIKLKDLNKEIANYLGKCTPDDVQWFNDWTHGQRHSGFPGVILLTAEEKRRKKALKQIEARKLIKKKKGPGRRPRKM
jgi:hypothetical protein